MIAQLPRPFGTCDGCGIQTRIWMFQEVVIPLGAGLGVVEGRGICRICLALVVDSTLNPEDYE